jgi:hypothetical protein
MEHLKDRKKQIMTKNYQKFKKEYSKEVEEIKLVIKHLRE